jgi:hypothetical protein
VVNTATTSSRRRPKSFAVEPGVESDEVEGGGHDDVFPPCLGEASATGASDVGDLGRLGDRGLYSKFIDGQDEAARRRIAEALEVEEDEG